MEKKVKLSKGKQKIKDFCDKHNACDEGREWAMQQRNMSEVWSKAKYDWMLWFIQRPGLIDDKTLRLFACWCARNTPCGKGKTTWDMMSHEDCRNAVVVAERFANGESSKEDLAAAWSAARSAAWSGAWSAARSAERSAAASAAARSDQLKQLRKMVNPFKVVKHA